MFRNQAFFGICAAASILAACGGGGGNSNPPLADLKANGVASFTITVPAQVNAGTAKAPKFISPATQSISISVNGGTPMVSNLTPGSPGCTGSTPSFRQKGAAGGGVTCTINVTAPIGSDTFVVKLYSGPNGTGNALASSTVTQAIGDRTPITVTMNGVAATVAISLANGSPLVGQSASIPLNIVVKDSSGAIIVGPGNYDTPLTLTNSDTSGHVTLSATSVAGPNTVVTLNYDGNASVTAVTISASTSGTNISSVTPAVLRPANSQNGGGGVGVVTIGGNVYAEVPSAVGLIQVPLTANGVLVTTPPSPLPSASVSPTLAPNPNATLLPITSGIDACASAPVSGNIEMFCTNIDNVPNPAINVINLSSGQPTLLSTFATDGAFELRYSGGNCYICGITWDTHDSAILLSTGNNPTPGYRRGAYERYTTAGVKTGTTVPVNQLTENFGYNSATNSVSNFSYTEADFVDLNANIVYQPTTTLLSNYPDIDSSAIDPGTNVAVGVTEYGSDEFFVPLGAAALTPPVESSTGAYTDALASKLPITNDPSNISPGYDGCDPSAITIDTTSHIAFLSGEYSGPNCVSAIQLPATAPSAAVNITQYMSILELPNTPDGSQFVSALDPHVAATFYLSGTDVYGLLYDYCRSWVAVVDITKLLAAPGWSSYPHIVDPAYDLIGNHVVTYVSTGMNPGPASNGYGSYAACQAGHTAFARPGAHRFRR